MEPNEVCTTHLLMGAQSLCLIPNERLMRILFVCSGSVGIKTSRGQWQLEEKALFVADPKLDVTITANVPSCILEIRREITEGEMAQVCSGDAELPYSISYHQAEQYTEDCKSAKTVSRMLVPARIVPRFAMGSVQTSGPDIVATHTHPVVNQYFFGLEENRCIVLIDSKEVLFGGNTLLHIPLGAEHGVKLERQHVCHYLWIDFLLNEDGLEYMDQAHKIKGRHPQEM